MKTFIQNLFAKWRRQTVPLILQERAQIIAERFNQDTQEFEFRPVGTSQEPHVIGFRTEERRSS